MKNIITLRSLTYTTTKKKLTDMGLDGKFRDLAEVGSMLNAFALAEDELPQQVAMFAADGGGPITREISLMGGLLYDATILAKRLVDKYKDHPSVYTMGDFFYFMTAYQPPAVLVDYRGNLPFGLYCRSGKRVWRLDSLDGRGKLVRRMQYDEKGIPFAVITDGAVLGNKGEENDTKIVKPTLDRMVDDAIEEFAYAAENFIDIMARELGLEDTPEPTALKLAA